MRIWGLLLCLLLAGCRSGLVFKEAPQTVLDSRQTTKLVGEIQPWGLYFTALSHYDGEQTRLLILSEIGIKLLDMGISAQQMEVYFKAEALPKVAAAAFGRFAKTHLQTACPEQQISFTDSRTRARFSVQATGEEKCL